MSDKPKVCVAIHIEDDLKAKISDVCDMHVVSSNDELMATVGDAEGVLGSPRIKADAAFFDAAPELRVFSTCSVGYDPVDVPEATSRGIVVCHTPGVLNNAVANLTQGMVFALALRLFPNEAHVRGGGWGRREQAPPLGNDIQGKTFGVIGFGRIGQEVTRRMQALGMRTLWYDVFDTPHESAPESEYRPLNDLLAESDYVSLHTNLDASSRHLMSTDAFSRMKSTAFLINAARGGLVDQKALAHALETDQIAGAALDVVDPEPPEVDDPFVRLPNLICFPHIGSATEETRRAMRELAVQNTLDVLAGKRPPAPVNPEVMDR